MASNFNNLLVALFFTAVASASVAHGIIFEGTQINIVQVQALGLLTCNVPGSNLPGNPITNATVAINCVGRSFTPGKTDLTGLVSVAYQTVEGVLFDTSSCNATITLVNALSCTVYPPTFTTAVTLTITNIVETAVGQVATFALFFVLPLVGL